MKRWHTIPINDALPHEPTLECFCYPLINGDVVIHNAKDLRDAYARHGWVAGDSGWQLVPEV